MTLRSGNGCPGRFLCLLSEAPLGWNHGLGFGLIALGAFLFFHEWL